MADVPIEGRENDVIPVPKEDKNAVHTKTKSESKTQPQEVTTSQGFMYQPGNGEEAMVRLTQAISINLNYLIEMMKAMMPEDVRKKFLADQAARNAAIKATVKGDGRPN